jgi:hypothetical protein
MSRLSERALEQEKQNLSLQVNGICLTSLQQGQTKTEYQSNQVLQSMTRLRIVKTMFLIFELVDKYVSK